MREVIVFRRDADITNILRGTSAKRVYIRLYIRYSARRSFCRIVHCVQTGEYVVIAGYFRKIPATGYRK